MDTLRGEDYKEAMCGTIALYNQTAERLSTEYLGAMFEFQIALAHAHASEFSKITRKTRNTTKHAKDFNQCFANFAHSLALLLPFVIAPE